MVLLFVFVQILTSGIYAAFCFNKPVLVNIQYPTRKPPYYQVKVNQESCQVAQQFSNLPSLYCAHKYQLVAILQSETLPLDDEEKDKLTENVQATIKQFDFFTSIFSRQHNLATLAIVKANSTKPNRSKANGHWHPSTVAKDCNKATKEVAPQFWLEN